MKKLYDKSEICFAIVWIIAYCVLASIGDNLSAEMGLEKIVTLPILLLLSAILWLFVRKNGLSEVYGLCKGSKSKSQMLYYAPLLLLITTNFWHGVAVNTSATETVLYILSMFCVGFLEELIFRGLLLRAMLKNGVKSAILISSVTFGIGHLINLFNGSGAELLPNLLQVTGAIAVGFLFAVICYKARTLLPCMITHSLINATSIFEKEATGDNLIFSCICIILIAVGYALYLAYADRAPERK